MCSDHSLSNFYLLLPYWFKGPSRFPPSPCIMACPRGSGLRPFPTRTNTATQVVPDLGQLLVWGLGFRVLFRVWGFALPCQILASSFCSGSNGCSSRCGWRCGFIGQRPLLSSLVFRMSACWPLLLICGFSSEPVSGCLSVSSFFVAAQGLHDPLQALSSRRCERRKPCAKAAPILGGLGSMFNFLFSKRVSGLTC